MKGIGVLKMLVMTKDYYQQHHSSIQPVHIQKNTTDSE